MAYTDRNILITPNIGSSTSEPIIKFTGATSVSSASTYIRVLDNGSVAYEGANGQLSSTIDSVSGTLFAVTDKSGIPSLEVLDTGAVNIAKYQGIVYVGNNTASTTTGTGALQVLGGVGVSGNLNIGGSFAMNANLGVGGATSTYGLNVNTTTNVAAWFSSIPNGTGLTLMVGGSTYPNGIGFNSYNNVGTTYVIGTGYNGQLTLSGGVISFDVSAVSQSAGALATQLRGLSISSTGILVPQSTAITISSGVASTGTGAIVTYGGISAGGGIVSATDGFFSGLRVGTGNSNIVSNTVIGNAAGANLLTGGSNVAIGYQAGNALTSAAQNTAIGYQALLIHQATGGANTAIGFQAMYSSNNAAMANNTAIGYRAMGSGNGGFYANTGIGYYALNNITGGYNNTAIGYNAGNNIIGGASNVCIGYGAGTSLGANNNCVIVGGANGATIGANNNWVLLSDGAGNVRMSFNSNGDATIASTTAANGTGGIGALTVTGGASIASGLTLGGALYIGGSAGTSGYALTSTGTGLQWAQTGVSIVNDTSTNANRYLTFSSAVSGSITTLNVNSTNVLVNPSTGIITAGGFSGPHNGTVGATTAASGNFTTLAGTQLTITNGGTAASITGPATGALTINNASAGVGGGVCCTFSGSGDVNHTSGAGIYFGTYSSSGTRFVGNGGGEWYLYRTTTAVLQSQGTGAAQVNGVLYVTSDVYTNYSDIRLKTVLAPITSASAKLKTLDTFTYVNNDLAHSLGQTTTREQVGVNAAQVKAVQPEAVGIAALDVNEHGESKSGENYLTVQYEKLVPLVIAGHNEHSDEIAALKAEIAELKALVAGLLK
jgi:hypothetical protein